MVQRIDAEVTLPSDKYVSNCHRCPG